MDFSNFPIGFGADPEENEAALNAFYSLADAQKQAVLARVREAENIAEVHALVNALATKTDFL